MQAKTTRSRPPFVRPLGLGCLALVVALGLPVHAAAQFTLTGRLLEQLPGGGTPEEPYFVLAQRIDSTGDKTSPTISLYPCVAPATTNCIRLDGTFTTLDVQPGLYLVRFVTFNNGTHLDKMFNVSVNGHTDIGTIPLVRAPFNVDLNLGPIPSSGGQIPLTVRAQTRWNIPSLPVTAQLWQFQEDVNGQMSRAPSFFDFLWPAGFADSGVVALPPINVRSTVPAGAETCVELIIVLRSQPDLVLGQDFVCGNKRP